MEQLTILGPALLLAALTVVTFAAYSILCLVGRAPEVDGLYRRRFTDLFGPFVTRYALWVIGPFERALVKSKISPNALTGLSLLACAAAGVLIAFGTLATAAWLYVLAGLLDILDGRLARATNRQSKAGAFLDSVADRWGELFVFSGFAWYLRDSNWLPVVVLAVAGSLMVSYTRARGQALGVELDGGTMQRAERITLVSFGLLCTAFFNAARGADDYGPHVIGVALLMVALASTATAVRRWFVGYRKLKGGMTSAEPVSVAPPAAAPTTGEVKVPISSKHRPAA